MAKVRLIDVVKPVCPGWHQHYQLRRWVRSLPSQAYIVNQGVYLIVTNDPDPCNWYVTVEDMMLPTERMSWMADLLMEGFVAGLSHNARE